MASRDCATGRRPQVWVVSDFACVVVRASRPSGQADAAPQTETLRSALHGRRLIPGV